MVFLFLKISRRPIQISTSWKRVRFFSLCTLDVTLLSSSWLGSNVYSRRQFAGNFDNSRHVAQKWTSNQYGRLRGIILIKNSIGYYGKYVGAVRFKKHRPHVLPIVTDISFKIFKKAF